MILIVYLIENHSHLIKVENHAERACFDMLAIGLDILGPGRFRPGPPRNTKTTFGWFFHLRLGRVGRHWFRISPSLPITRDVVLNDKPI